MIRKSRSALLIALLITAGGGGRGEPSSAAPSAVERAPALAPRRGLALLAENTAWTEWRCVDGEARLFVVGRLTVTNAGTAPTETLQLAETLEYKAPGSTSWTTSGDGFTVPSAGLQPGETLTHEYEIQLASWSDAATYRSSVEITMRGDPGSPAAKGPSPRSSFLIVEQPVDLCALTCTISQGYWKRHGPSALGRQTNEWPVRSLTLGLLSYGEAQLQAVLDASTAGNGLVSLAHQLIAAKLNIAAGADPDAIAAALSAADALIGSLRIPPTGSGFVHPSRTATLTAQLEAYNQGSVGPGHCD